MQIRVEITHGCVCVGFLSNLYIYVCVFVEELSLMSCHWHARMFNTVLATEPSWRRTSFHLYRAITSTVQVDPGQVLNVLP